MSVTVRSESGSPVAASTPPGGMRWRSRWDGWIALAFVLVALVVFNANLRVISTGDSLSSRYVPISLWAHGTTAVDPFARLARDGHVRHYWITLSRGEFISTYSLVTPLLVTPLYAPAAIYLHSVGWVEEAIRGVAKVMEKLSASFVAALSVGLMFVLLRRRVGLMFELMFVLLRRRVGPGSAVLLTFAYAFGTSTWMISSQALWQHGPAQLFVVFGLLVVTGSSSPMGLARALALAVTVGLLVANRLQDLPLALGFVAFASVAFRDRRSTLILFTSLAIALGAAIAYNTYTFGSPVGGYSSVDFSTFGHPLWAGLSGMLFSPGRGLLAYAPFFAFLVLRFRRTDDAPRFGRLDLCLGAGVLLLYLMYASTNTWTSIYVYGPRMLTEAVPILIWLLAPVVPDLRRWGRAAFIACVALAVAVQAIGAFYFPGPASAGSDDFWRVSRYPPLLAARLGPSAFDLPGFTRDLWEPPPLEIRVSAATSVHGDTVRVAVGLAPAVPRGAVSPFTVSVDVSEEDGAGRFGFGSALVPGLEGESTVIMEFDLATRAIRVDPGGIAGVTTDRWVGEVGEGRFRAVLGVWRQDSPAFRPVYPLFEFTREGGAVEVVETRGVAPVGVALRVRQGR